MSETIDPGLVHRLRNTPLRDLLRGQVSGRLDWRARLATAGLPPSAEAMIQRVVQRTRLWRSEKVDVADELVAHFQDGLASGAAADDLINAFGLEGKAARLIRRAKKRNRPFAWHILRAVGWMLVGWAALYACLAVYFFAGRPGVTRDYLAIINQSTNSAAPDERAWPIYRKAMLSVGSALPESKAWGIFHATYDSGWPEFLRWVQDHQQTVALVREAAGRPSLGIVYGPDGSAYDAQLYPERRPVPADEPHREMLISTLIPHVTTLRQFSMLLEADAQLARETGDAARLRQDLDAMLGMAEQQGGSRFLIEDLVRLAVRDRALSAIGRSLQETPQLFSDDDLRALAHRISGPRTAADLITYRGERMAFEDVIQRMYTDNGKGDGRITPEGIRMLNLISGPVHPPRAEVQATLAAAPAVLPLLASKKQVIDKYAHFMDAAEANLSRPMREADWKSYDEQARPLHESLVHSIQYAPVAIMLPALSQSQWSAEKVLARQDAITAALAVEIYRRKNGKLPATLEELTPSLLPRVPLDRIDGRPLNYQIVNGKPVIYSIGVDRDDDGGRTVRNSSGEPEPRRAAQLTWESDKPLPDGDWVLYPVIDPVPPPPSGPATAPAAN